MSVQQTATSATWQQTILDNFMKRERMLLVIDPDNLLRDGVLLAEIQNRNYDVLELEDEVSFRNRFERDYRSRWDDGQALHIVVVVHTTNGERHIPYDILQKGKRIELTVSQLFPNLNAIVTAQLDNAYYADLYPAHQGLVERREMLRGERQTIEFILRTVFDLDPVGAADPARWVEFLIHKHYSARELPAALEQYVVEQLMPQAASTGVRPEFLSNPASFYAWLGETWATFVSYQCGQGDRPPVDLDDPRLRPLLGFLFTEGLIVRTPAVKLPAGKEWMVIGIRTPAPVAAKKELGVRESSKGALYGLRARLDRFSKMDMTFPEMGKEDLREWLNLANEWAEVVYTANNLPQEDYQEVQAELAGARLSLDGAFWLFIQSRYSAVDYYQDNIGPICLTAANRWFYHHVDEKERLFLLCFDGMALDQWLLLREKLQAVIQFEFKETRTFAVAPTLTPVSRQALFAGQAPVGFSDTVHRTDKDGERWMVYWVNRNIPRRRIHYLNLKLNQSAIDGIQEIAGSKSRRLG
ncbi:MAG: BREX-3 system phosphatase PglZ, partial [Anaerolineales bacterium]|nr:BREX-3 system phosphatase PglZ [Anaerolineales bacterium]